MNRDRIQGICKQLDGKLKECWGVLNDDPVAIVAGRRDQQSGRTQEQRGISREAADRQIEEFFSRNRDWWNLPKH